MAESISLNELTIPQIDLILSKLCLTSPDSYEEDGRLELLRCNNVFNRNLGRYGDEDVLAMFKKGKFVDFSTTDGKVDGIFPKVDNTEQYPCSVCSNEVSDKLNESGYGIECSGCGLYFHNNCTSKPLSVPLFKALKDSPSYVKILCPPCNSVYGGVEKKVKRIERKVERMSNSMDQLCAEVCEKFDSLVKTTGCSKDDVTEVVKSYSEVTLASQRKTIEEAISTKSTEAVAEKVVHKLDVNQIEREKRKLNVVIKNVPESDGVTAGQRKADDLKYCTTTLGITRNDIESWWRAGKKDNEKPDRIRPLIVKLVDEETVNFYSNNGKGYKPTDNPNGLWINKDLCEADRKANFLARQERRARLAKRNSRETRSD